MAYGRHGVEIPPGMEMVHPNSTWLLQSFTHHPYQGRSPVDARNIFVALDANWPEAITDELRELINAYFGNAGTFWANHHEHHPLRVLAGEDGGRKYHANVRKLFEFAVEEHGFHLGGLVNATSFVELLGAPTFGRATHHRAQYFQYAVDHGIYDNLAHINNVIVGQVLQPDPIPAVRKSVFLVGITTLRWFLDLRARAQLHDQLNFLGPNPDIPTVNQMNPIPQVFETAGAIVRPMTHFSGNVSDDHLRAVAHWLQV